MAPSLSTNLPQEQQSASQADRFTRAREVQAVALLEDYVEMIGDLIAEHGEARVADIAERMGVAQPTATKAIARLKREGLATSRPYRGVFLTNDGAAWRIGYGHGTVRLWPCSLPWVCLKPPPNLTPKGSNTTSPKALWQRLRRISHSKIGTNNAQWDGDIRHVHGGCALG